MPIVTLTKVEDVSRSYATKNGQYECFKVYEGDRVGEVTAKAGNGAKRVAEFRALIGVPTEMIVEDAGNWDDGTPKPKKIKLPQSASYSENKSGGSSWYNSEEGVRFTQDRMDRRTALMQASAAHPNEWLSVAQEMYEWLQGGGGTVGPDATSGSSAARVGKAAAEGSKGGGSKNDQRGDVSTPQESSGDEAPAVTGPSPDDHKFSPWPPDGITMLDGQMWCLTHGKAEIP